MEAEMTDGPHTGAAQPPLSPAERALAEKADRYRSLFAYSPHGVLSLDLTGHLTEANDALEQLTGRSRGELLEVDYRDIIHPEDIVAAEKAFEAVKARVPQLLEARMVTPVGEVREVRLTAVPVVVFDQVVGVHGMTEDVTETNKMHRDLEAANTAKTLFLANVSHEVRTPLTMVLGATEILLDTELDPGQGQLTDMVHRNSRRLLRLVNDILDFSRLEAGKISLLPAPFRLAGVIEEILEWAQPRAAARGVRLSTTLDAALPTNVHGDALRVSQVLSNLVDNALKFTESGSVDITMSLRAPTTPGPEAGTVRVEFVVADTGVGFSPEHLKSMFDTFTQADQTNNGVGLGLAICRDLVDLMGGDLGAVSTPGTGSTFTAVLPLVGLPDERVDTPPP
jgi:PAS domain S-box-containing protein